MFSFTNVRSANYGLYSWADGGEIADVASTFEHNNVVVSNGDSVDLGSLLWQSSKRERIFQLGDIDHKATGFQNSGAYQHGLAARSPANLTYTVGVSNESEWYYAQSSFGSWTILFNVDSSNGSENGTAILGVSLAGYSQSADLLISVNGQQVGSLLKDNLASDPALYRSGTVAGEWRYYEFNVDAGLLRHGQNSVVFQVTRYTLWRGFLWDSIFLDWSS